MKTKTKASLDAMQLSDVYSLMFFILYKTQELPEYATLSEMCYLLDGSNMTRLLTYFAGKTVTIPTADELVLLANALLLYQYVNLEGLSVADAQLRLTNVAVADKGKIMDLYLKILPIINEYNIDRSQISKYDR